MIIKGKKTETVELELSNEQVKDIVLEYLYTEVLKVLYPIEYEYEYINGDIVYKYEKKNFFTDEYEEKQITLREASTTDILTLKMIKIIENMK